MSGRKRIFISSVQKETASERAAVRDFVHGDALLSRFFDIFLFEDIPAVDRRAVEVYLSEVERSDVCVSILANEYGYEARGFALDVNTPVSAMLAHLNLIDRNRPSRAAILLFGKAPQRFLPTSEIKCMHFHGTEVRKPIPSYQIYKGTVFELVDQAVDFVMSKITRRVGTRSESPQAPVDYELPRDAVAEAIVNAVAHRDYSSNASVQVMLFAD